jgi:integrase
MARPGRTATGQLRIHEQKDGTKTFSIRVRYGDERYTVRLGDEADGWSERRAEIELENTMAKIQAGIWEPPDPAVNSPHEQPTMHELASLWLRRKKGEGIRPNTVDDYEWQLGSHLLPFFGRMRPTHINDARVEEYIDLKIAEREEVLDAQAAGIVLRDANRRPRRTLSNRTINAQLVTLAAILGIAERRGWVARNAAKGHRLKTRTETGSVLEGDEVWSLIVAAGELDRTVNSARTLDRGAEVRRLRDVQKLAWKDIAMTLGCAESTAIYYYAQRDGRAPSHRLVRRALLATLAGAGLRVTEAAELNHEDIDLAHRKLRIRDAKTDAGVREVHLSPWLVQELSDYFASLPVQPAGGDPAFPTRRRGRRDKDNIRKPRPATRAREGQRDAREAEAPTDHRAAHTPHPAPHVRVAPSDGERRASARDGAARAHGPEHDPAALRPGAPAPRLGEDGRGLRPAHQRRAARGPPGSVFPTDQDAGSNRRFRARFELP